MAKRRKSKWVSPGSAAARLAHWRWHHNPAFDTIIRKTVATARDLGQRAVQAATAGWADAKPKAQAVAASAPPPAPAPAPSAAIARSVEDRLTALELKTAKSNPARPRKVSYFHGIGYNGARVDHNGKPYLYVTSVLTGSELARVLGHKVRRLGKVGATKHGDPVCSYVARCNPRRSRARCNPVQHIDHAAYQAKVRKMTDAQLHYTRADAREAIRAMPEGDKAGYYADEINYCSDELNRRRKGGQRENPRRRVRRARGNPVDLLPPTLAQIKADLPRSYTATGDPSFAWGMSRRSADLIAKAIGWKLVPGRQGNWRIKHPDYNYWIA